MSWTGDVTDIDKKFHLHLKSANSYKKTNEYKHRNQRGRKIKKKYVKNNYGICCGLMLQQLVWKIIILLPTLLFPWIFISKIARILLLKIISCLGTGITAGMFFIWPSLLINQRQSLKCKKMQWLILDNSIPSSRHVLPAFMYRYCSIIRTRW